MFIVELCEPKVMWMAEIYNHELKIKVCTYHIQPCTNSTYTTGLVYDIGIKEDRFSGNIPDPVES